MKLILAALLISLLSPVQGQQRDVLSAKAVDKLLPLKIQGYSRGARPNAVLMKVGDLKYAMCDRSFKTKSAEVKMMLFDYAEARIMFDQSKRKWDEMIPVDNDSIYFSRQHTAIASRWESYQSHSQTAQVIMSIHDRFFLNISSTRLSLAELKEIVDRIDLSVFPK